MLHSVPSPQNIKTQAIRTELRRLHLRRSAIDRLVQALELYSRHAATAASDLPKTKAIPKIGPVMVKKDISTLRARAI